MQTVYPLMGIAANVALVLAGSWVKFVNSNLVPAAGGSTQVCGHASVPRLLLMTMSLLLVFRLRGTRRCL